jgi:replicative DNA helicase
MFVARPGCGKTFLAVIAARYAWLQGHRVLIVSPEMSKEEIAERFFVVEADVSYKDLIHGQLSDLTTLPALEKKVDDLKTAENLWVMDASDDISPKGIEAAIRACHPALVAVDSIYDLKIKGTRQERALGALEWMKNAAKRHEFACCGFAQQNRIAELSERKGGGSRLGTIALADEIGQDAHAVFALERSKDDKDDKILWVKPLKLRRGQISRDRVGLNWDFDQMRWDEIPDDEDKFSDDEEIPF